MIPIRSLAALSLAHGLFATTLSAQYAAPRRYAQPVAAYYTPQAAVPAYYAPYGGQPVVYRNAPHWQPPYCPPGYQLPAYGPYPQRPTQPSQQPQPSTEATPRQSQPSEQSTQSQANQQQPQTDQQQQQQQPDFTPSPDTSSRASLSPGANTPQLGRNDQTNRLNLFDNMAAAPQTRAWFGFQFSSQFDTALRPTHEFQSFLAANPSLTAASVLLENEAVGPNAFVYDQCIYRAGGEYAICPDVSISFQAQYYASVDPGAPPDSFTNPQLMLKIVAYRDCDTVISPTLGATIQVGTDIHAINEGTSKIYPGILFYQGLTDDLFMQGGAQVGIPTDTVEIYHADWSLGLGYWLYRERGHGCCCDPPDFLKTLHITGLIPQFNILGKHVLGSSTIVGPFGYQPSVTTLLVNGIPTPVSLPDGFVIYDEPRAVVDLTIGGQILLGDRIQLGLGYSFPVTGRPVRDNEFLSTLTYVF